MKKRPYFMIFYEDLALLHQTANKQTMFFMQMLSKMDKDQIVQMTGYVRKNIISHVSPGNENKLELARQYLKRLSKDGLIRNVGDGAYMINPKISGYSNVDKFQNEKSEIFIKLKYKHGKRKIEVNVE